MEETADLMIEYALKGEEICSNPSYIMQWRQNANKTPETLGKDFGYYGDWQDIEGMDEQRQWRRSKIQSERYMEDMQRLNSQSYTTKGNRKTRVDENGNVLPSKPWTDNDFILPEQMELTSQTLPKTRTDLLDILRFNNSEIYRSFGIPEFLITGITSGKNGTSDTINDTFKITITSCKNLVSVILTKVYNHIYGQSDAENILDQLFNNEDVDPMYLDPNQLDKIKNENRFEIQLPIKPFINFAHLKEYHENGIITDLEFCNFSRKNAGLPPVERVIYVPPKLGQMRSRDFVNHREHDTRLDESDEERHDKARKKLNKRNHKDSR